MPVSVSLYPTADELRLIDRARGEQPRSAFIKRIVLEHLADLHGADRVDVAAEDSGHRLRMRPSGWVISLRLRDDHYALLRQSVGPEATINGWILLHLSHRLGQGDAAPAEDRADATDAANAPPAPVGAPRRLGHSAWRVGRKAQRGGE